MEISFCKDCGHRMIDGARECGNCHASEPLSHGDCVIEFTCQKRWALHLASYHLYWMIGLHRVYLGEIKPGDKIRVRVSSEDGYQSISANFRKTPEKLLRFQRIPVKSGKIQHVIVHEEFLGDFWMPATILLTPARYSDWNGSVMKEDHYPVLAPAVACSTGGIAMTATQNSVQLQKSFPGAASLSDEQKRWMVSLDNPENPFHNLIGQTEVLPKLCRLAFQALGREDHCASDISVALLGPAGTGKTTIAKKFAQLLDLPFVNLNPKSLKTTEDIFFEINKTLSQIKVRTADGESSLKLVPDEFGEYTAPPCVVFIDEVHQLVSDVEQGLLVATEGAEPVMGTPSGKVLGCMNVCWVIATTDRGKLFDAFDTRFSKATLKTYSPEEVAEIINVNVPEVPLEVCDLITKYCWQVTREAIDFATEVIHQRKMTGSTWEEAVEQIRKEQRIDEFGMSETRLAILTALGDRGPIAIGKLQGIAKVKTEELSKFILPPMEMFDDYRDAIIQSSSRGYWITEQGLKELERRGIPHKGSSVLPKR